MRLKDDYGKEFILLDEENLIYRRRFRKITIKRSEIRSAFYDENILGILTYSGKIYSLNIVHLLFSERKKLEELRLELNKENILFDYTNYRFSVNNLPVLWAWTIMFFVIGNVDKFIYEVFVVLFFIFLRLLIKVIIPNVIYNIDSNKIEIIIFKKIIKYKREEIDKINLIKINDNINIIEFKKKRIKYKLYFIKSPYLIKIYNLSLIKLLNNNF